MENLTTIYIDAEYRCFLEPAEGRREIQAATFAGKESLITMYRYVPPGEVWTRADGVSFYGEMIAPAQEGDTSADIMEIITTLEAENAELKAAFAEVEEAANG